MRRKGHNRSGFTLIELLITLAAGSILVIAMHRLYTRFVWVSTGQERLLEIQQEARIAMDRMAKEIRAAGCYYQQLRIVTADTSLFEFESDTDPDPTNGPWMIQYYQSGTDLMRKTRLWNGSSYNPTYTGGGVANNIVSLTFTYYDGNGVNIPAPVASADLANIRTVDVDIKAQTADPNPATSKYDSIRLVTGVYLKCMDIQ